jgi:hypothetical protein
MTWPQKCSSPSPVLRAGRLLGSAVSCTQAASAPNHMWTGSFLQLRPLNRKEFTVVLDFENPLLTSDPLTGKPDNSL